MILNSIEQNGVTNIWNRVRETSTMRWILSLSQIEHIQIMHRSYSMIQLLGQNIKNFIKNNLLGNRTLSEYTTQMCQNVGNCIKPTPRLKSSISNHYDKFHQRTNEFSQRISSLFHTYNQVRLLSFYLYFMGIFLLCIILTVYINTNRSEKSSVNCTRFPSRNFTMSPLRKRQSSPYPTYIIAKTMKRFNFTFSNLQTAVPNFFNIKQKEPVSVNDSRMNPNNDYGASSLLLTYIDLWNDFGAQPDIEYSDNDWMFIFEDDVNIVHNETIRTMFPELYAKWNTSNPSTSIAGIVEQGLEMAKDDGILYLGTCGPEYRDNNTTIRYSNDGLFQFRRGVYFCTHAVAYTKWRARRMWSDLAAYSLLHGETGSDTLARQWMLLSNTFPISAAVNVAWPPEEGHYGLFYQDRGAIPSTRV